MRTEVLLGQLQGSNVELEQRRKELEEKAKLLEVRNREIAEAGASLESKAQELTKVSQYKSQFLTNMSHEIRTPLNSMMVLAQMLAANEDQGLGPQQQEWAATIHAAGRDLLALINQILDLSKVEAGRIETHFEPFPVEAMREMVERDFRPLAQQKQLELTVDIAETAPTMVPTDQQLLKQVLKNLLSNAFRFTEKGHVRVRIDRAPADTRYRNESLSRTPGVMAISISDTGIGIPVSKLESIFEAFHQADTTVTRRYGGTGLGLSISREYARILGGEIAVESIEGTSSTFTLYLPLPLQPPALPARPTAAAPETAMTIAPLSPEDARRLSGKKFLVVEDDARNLYAITSFLERQGATVIPAASAREAFVRLESTPDIDLILMDIMMAEIDGYEATRQIHARPGFASLPIIALTAKASDSDRKQSLAAGCCDYIAKPADNRQLVSLILVHLRP
jgi:signal transduction histidine kinase